MCELVTIVVLRKAAKTVVGDEDWPCKQQVEHLLRTCKAAVGGQKDVDVGRVDFTSIGAQVLDQLVECAIANDAHLLQTPLLDRALVITVVRL